VTKDRLVLWRWEEAEDCDGDDQSTFRSIGSQMKRVEPGDRLFFCATREGELYLLGAMRVRKVASERDPHLRKAFGTYCATGASLSRPFRIIPLGDLKWKLRFTGGTDRLSRTASLPLQFLSHRLLAPQSATRLLNVLKQNRERRRRVQSFLKAEGKKLERHQSVRERSPQVRKAALARYGRACMVCGFDFEETYGPWASDCVEVHHLRLLKTYPKGGRLTDVGDVIVVCPNCHRALHRYADPSDWRRFKRECELG
jgi:hypothetical protein